MKLRERIIIFFSATFALLTLLFVVDLQYDFGYNGQGLLFPTRHARVEIIETGGGVETLMKSYQPRVSTDGTTSEQNVPVKPPEPHDPFDDLAKLAFPVDGTSSEFIKSSVVVVVFENRDRQPMLADILVGMDSEEGYV